MVADLWRSDSFSLLEEKNPYMTVCTWLLLLVTFVDSDSASSCQVQLAERPDIPRTAKEAKQLASSWFFHFL